MRFVEKPENDFQTFINTYYHECAGRFPKIEAIAGKWEFCDLIPGMSDFDSRFLCADDMSASDWCDMSQAVGEVHLKLCREHPEWSRILEHLPGVNPTWSEFLGDATYYPEYGQWSIYAACDEERLARARSAQDAHVWDGRDEHFFLKKFMTFYGPYDRAIDPAINMGVYENKYPLHSRIMHYFLPPLQAAVSLVERRVCRGKFSALEKAAVLFPELMILPELTAVVGRHYEDPGLYEEPALSGFETRLKAALDLLFVRVCEVITILPEAKREHVDAVRCGLKEVALSPRMRVFDSSRFCRLFKGRMHFYTNAPAYFDSIWLIQNELGRVGSMFFREPYSVYWQETAGFVPTDLIASLDELAPSILTREQVAATKEFARLVPGTWEKGAELDVARRIIPIFDDVFTGLYRLTAELV